MARDNQETVTLNDPTAWQETAMPAAAAVEPDPRIRVSQDDLMAAVHGGVITGVQAKALWLRWSNPGQAASPGPRTLPEPVAAVQPASGSGHGTLVTVVLVVVAAVAGWVLRGLMR